MVRSTYHTNGMSMFTQKIMKGIIQKVSFILKDILGFVERWEKYSEIGTVLGVAHIRYLYTIIFHYLELKTLEYWIQKLQHKIKYLQIFAKNFNLAGMSAVLKNNCFCINGSLIYQINETNIGTHAVFVYESLTWMSLEIKIFTKLPEILSYDTI